MTEPYLKLPPDEGTLGAFVLAPRHGAAEYAQVAMAGHADLTHYLGSLEDKLERRLAALDGDEVIRRIWNGDHTVWSPDPNEITQPNRLGWLAGAREMIEQTPELESFAAGVVADGIETLVLLGMGGSSLAPEVIARTLPLKRGYPALRALDTTVPDEIAAVERDIDLSKTLFIVASKSGTTVETSSQLAYFWDKLPDGGHFIAITDPGTPLAALAQERGFRRVFLNREDIGGRYSALSYFGLVPGALVGAEIQTFLRGALAMMEACRAKYAAHNPGAVLGAALGEAALAGRDKLTLVLAGAISSLGDWTEQLIAESTGKGGKGIIPVVGEALGAPEAYGADRLFVSYGNQSGVEGLATSGQPLLTLPFDTANLGAEFFRWEFATAVAGHVLGLNPFDQPDVQRAKEAAEQFLGGGEFGHAGGGDLTATLKLVRPGDYLAIQAFLPRSDALRARLDTIRQSLRDRLRVATTVGFGPRYLHSTGQLHKGGPSSGVFIQLVGEDEVDVPIPGRSLTFGALKRAQAQGDFETLVALGRRAVRTTLEAVEEIVI